MLAASPNQYLRTEYLNPIQGSSVELDAKKSPLALLAQTCSQIGSDASTKSTQGGTEKSKGKSSPGAKSPCVTSLSSDESKPSAPFKPYEKKKEEDGRGSPPRRPTIRNKSPEMPRTHSRGSDGSRTPSRPHDVTSSITTSKGSTSPLYKGSISSLGDFTKDPLAAYKLNPILYSPLGLGLESLTSAGFSALTSKVPTSSGSLNSAYVGYARVKTVSGTETIIAICRDPCCSSCQINTHALQVVNETCPPGCSQCAQLAINAKTLASLPSSLIPAIPASSLTSLYQSSLLGSSTGPYVCNWASGDSSCGKRFSSSDELLLHVRSHTNISSSESLHIPSLTHPILPHAHLNRGYPTPPLSPLSASRYHPYAKSPLGHLSHSAAASALSAASLSALAAPHPLAAYYNPYSIYARSLSATAGLHP